MIKEFIPAVEFLERRYDEYNWDVRSEDPGGGYLSHTGLYSTHVFDRDGSPIGPLYAQPMFTLKGGLDQDGPSEEVENAYECGICRSARGHLCPTCQETRVTCSAASDRCLKCYDDMLASYIRYAKFEEAGLSWRPKRT
jgi:hypothetical protein